MTDNLSEKARDGQWQELVERHFARAQAAEAQVEALRKALEPFRPAYAAYVAAMQGFTVTGSTEAERRFSEGERHDTAMELAFEALSKVTLFDLAAVEAALSAPAEERSAVASSRETASGPEESGSQPAPCSPADGYAGCNFKRTDRLDACHEAGGCLAPRSEQPELSADFVRALPGGKWDDSAYEAVEEALDRAEAPIQVGGKWLTLPERVAALAEARSVRSVSPREA